VTEPAARTRMSAPVLLAVLVTIFAWASAFVLIRDLRDVFDPGALALGRIAAAAIALTIAVAVSRAWVTPTRREWGLLAVTGAGWFAIYNVLLNAAEQRIDAGTAALLLGTGPILIALLSGVVLREGFPRWLMIGGGVAFAGVALIAESTRSEPSYDPIGVVLCLLASTCWAIAVLAQKPTLRRIPPLQATQLACVIGLVCLLPFAGQLTDNLGQASEGDVAKVIYLGVVPTALAFVTWAYALSHTDAGRLGATTYVVPVLTVIIAWPLLGETPPPLALVGGAIALIGVALTRRR